jgi:hypothetical protein
MHKLTNDRMKWGRCALLVGPVLALAHLATPYVWLRLPAAVVSLDGKLTAHAAVYRSPDGQLLVWIREPNRGAADIINPSAGEVFAPCYGTLLDDVPENNHFWVTPFFALIADSRYHAGWGHHFDDDYPSQGAVIRPGYSEFTELYLAPGTSHLRSQRVRVKL